jgi:hypothetical protein
MLFLPNISNLCGLCHIAEMKESTSECLLPMMKMMVNKGDHGGVLMFFMCMKCHLTEVMDKEGTQKYSES